MLMVLRVLSPILGVVGALALLRLLILLAVLVLGFALLVLGHRGLLQLVDTVLDRNVTRTFTRRLGTEADAAESYEYKAARSDRSSVLATRLTASTRRLVPWLIPWRFSWSRSTPRFSIRRCLQSRPRSMGSAWMTAHPVVT